MLFLFCWEQIVGLDAIIYLKVWHRLRSLCPMGYWRGAKGLLRNNPNLLKCIAVHHAINCIFSFCYMSMLWWVVFSLNSSAWIANNHRRQSQCFSMFFFWFLCGHVQLTLPGNTKSKMLSSRAMNQYLSECIDYLAWLVYAVKASNVYVWFRLPWTQP